MKGESAMPEEVFSRPLVATRGRLWSEHILKKARSRVEVNGLTGISDIRKGRAPDEILKAAKEQQREVIIGSRERSEVRRVTMGETGQAVLLTAAVSVIMVK
jgi:nucleotide-binding universal stress UspA family protein